jgi:hypothetical protein
VVTAYLLIKVLTQMRMRLREVVKLKAMKVEVV